MQSYQTLFTVVAGLEISGEVLGTRLDELSNVRNWQLTAPPAGAGAI